MVDKIADVLMERDGLTREQAEQRVKEARRLLMAQVSNGEYPFDFCYEEFGLEPDYLEELIF